MKDLGGVLRLYRAFWELRDSGALHLPGHPDEGLILVLSLVLKVAIDKLKEKWDTIRKDMEEKNKKLEEEMSELRRTIEVLKEGLEAVLKRRSEAI